jgi:putative endonuclease
MTIQPRVFGRKSEEMAAEFLRAKGYRIVERNYRTPRGELDLIALDGKTLVFVEVKARRGGMFGEPEWAVDQKKRLHLIKASLFYLTRKRIQNRACRFDVVAIQEFERQRPRIDHLCNAIEIEDDHLGI